MLDTRIALLAERYGISGLDFSGTDDLDFDINGSPAESLKMKLLTFAGEEKVEVGDKRVTFWRNLREMKDDTVLIYSNSQLRRTNGFNFAERVRTLLYYANINVNNPFVVSLDGIVDPDKTVPPDIIKIILSYIEEYKPLHEAYKEKSSRLGTEGFGKLTVYGIIGQVISIFGGFIGDSLNLFGNRIVESAVREIGGNGENVSYAIAFARDRKKSKLEKELLDFDGGDEHDATDAEIFVKAKLVGALLPIGVDIIFGIIGVDIHAKGLGVLPAFFYPVADTITAQAALWYYSCYKLQKKGQTLKYTIIEGTKKYFSKPSAVIGIASIFLAYGAGFLGRAHLWSDNKLWISGLEAAGANLCVFTPIGTALADYKFQEPLRELTERYVMQML